MKVETKVRPGSCNERRAGVNLGIELRKSQEEQAKQGSFPGAGKRPSEGRGQLCSGLREAEYQCCGWRATGGFPGVFVVGGNGSPAEMQDVAAHAHGMSRVVEG